MEELANTAQSSACRQQSLQSSVHDEGSERLWLWPRNYAEHNKNLTGGTRYPEENPQNTKSNTGDSHQLLSLTLVCFFSVA